MLRHTRGRPGKNTNTWNEIAVGAMGWEERPKMGGITVARCVDRPEDMSMGKTTLVCNLTT